MTFTIEMLPDEPIVICTMSAQFNPMRDYGAFWQQLGAILKDKEGPIYRITHLKTDQIEFSDMVLALAAEAKSGMPGSLTDPRIRSVLVNRSLLAQMAVESIQQEQYGQLETPLFGTLDEALAHVRSQLKS
jgi:hypothetical protein